MTCSARIPLYALVIQTFFAHRGALFRSLVFVTLYALGILSGLIASLVLRRTATKGRALPLVLEIPSLRSPSFVAVARKARQAASRFVRDVGTTILVSSAALWLLLSVKMPGTAPLAEGARPIEGSIAAYMGKALEPVTKPAGFDWRVNVGLIGSFGARELMVSTMGVISGIENADDDPAPLASKLREAKDSAGKPVYTARTGLALLAFFVIACQCMSTLAAVRRETKSLRWPVFVFAYTYAAGYVAALLTYHLSGLFGMV
jgi:ferrous iron transport protein B